jgi:hypothetical protein
MSRESELTICVWANGEVKMTQLRLRQFRNA